MVPHELSHVSVVALIGFECVKSSFVFVFFFTLKVRSDCLTSCLEFMLGKYKTRLVWNTINIFIQCKQTNVLRERDLFA